MSEIRENFIIETYRLSRIAPLVWRDFETAFRAYVAEFTEAAVRTPTGDALVAHGKASALLALRDDFQKIEETYKKLLTKNQSR
jgi:hypothetical protein